MGKKNKEDNHYVISKIITHHIDVNKPINTPLDTDFTGHYSLHPCYNCDELCFECPHEII